MAEPGPRWAGAQERARERLRSGFERSDASTSNNERFVGKRDTVEDKLKLETVGLVHLEDFQRKREELLEEKQRESARTKELKQKKKEQKRRKDRTTSKLSFDPDEGDEDLAEPVSVKKARRTEPDAPSPRTRTSVKDPQTDTSFLPDRNREEEERRIREELRQEWLQKQERLKQEEIEITYSFWDGSGHRNSVHCRKGDSIARFLELCRQNQPQLRNVPVDSLMYVKEDLIIPHQYTFYDFLVSKARGKSGPLFNFDVHDDVRLLGDASVEKDESHAGKVVERSWYNRNKHIFPASRWEIYDPNTDYGSYTVRDRICPG